MTSCPSPRARGMLKVPSQEGLDTVVVVRGGWHGSANPSRVISATPAPARQFNREMTPT